MQRRFLTEWVCSVGLKRWDMGCVHGSCSPLCSEPPSSCRPLVNGKRAPWTGPWAHPAFFSEKHMVKSDTPEQQDLLDGSDGKASTYNGGDPGSIPGFGRSSGEGNGNPLQYSCLENPMDGGAWWATVHGVANSQTRLSTSLSLFTLMHWRRQRHPTPVFLPGESQGRGNLVGCRLWGCTELDTTEVT